MPARGRFPSDVNEEYTNQATPKQWPWSHLLLRLYRLVLKVGRPPSTHATVAIFLILSLWGDRDNEIQASKLNPAPTEILSSAHEQRDTSRT